MSAPQRIQRKRTKGWRMPDNTVYVGRGSKWGNPFKVGDTQIRMPALDGSEWEYEGRSGKTSGEQHIFFHSIPDGETEMPTTWHQVKDATAEQCVELYREWIALAGLGTLQAELAGKNLACWCPLHQACHADLLLEIANQELG